MTHDAGDWGEQVPRRTVLGALAGVGVGTVLGSGTVAAAGGDVVWEFQTDWPVNSSPTVADGTVFVGSRYSSVYALDAGDGSQRWESDIGGTFFSSPTVVDGTVFIGGGSSRTTAYDRVYALDADDGSQRWEFETGENIWSSPTVADGTVFVGSGDNSVYALDAGVEGSSEGSRAMLRTLGYHAMGESFDTPDEGSDSSTGNGGSDDGGDGTEDGDGSSGGDRSDDGGDETDASDGSTPSETGSSDDGGDGFGPGFGVGGALAGLGGAGYLLKRRLENDENSEQ